MARVTFEDGPARFGAPARADGEQAELGDVEAGRLVLHLRRLPVFLRLVHDQRAGTWDALDQENDTPRAGERIHVYVRSFYAHSRGVGRMASYRHVPLRASEILHRCRDRRSWRAFVGELAEREAEHLRTIYAPEHALHG